MFLALILFASSVLGMAVLLLRRAPQVAFLHDEEVAFVKSTRESFGHILFGSLTDRMRNVWYTRLRTLFFGILARLVGYMQRFFSSTAKFCYTLLTKIRDRSSHVPRPSQYWQEIYSWKSNSKARLRGLRTPYRRILHRKGENDIITADPVAGAILKDMPKKQDEPDS